MTKRILLAEDDADDQEFFRAFLKERPDLELLPIAIDGAELLQQLEATTDPDALPHIILLDQNMPRLNGLQTMRRLKADPRWRHIPIGIYSTYTDDALLQTGAADGACAVLAKPLDEAGYNEMIEQLLTLCA